MKIDTPWRGLTDAKLRQMTRQETEVLLKMTLGAENRKEVAAGEPLPEPLRRLLMEHPWTNIMLNRLQAGLGVDDFAKVVDPEVVLVLMSLLESETPGTAVMWAFTVALLYAEKEADSPLSMDDLFFGPFGMGFPAEDAYEDAWDAQKRPGLPNGNLLDTDALWQPLRDAIEARTKKEPVVA